MEIYKTMEPETYDILRNIPARVGNEYARQILSLTKPNDTVLDAGFGSGSILIPLAKLNNNINTIVGIDHCKFFFDQVGRVVENVTNVKLFNQDLLLLREKHDVIHFKALLHCFQNPERMINQLIDHVKPRGYLITGHEVSQWEDRLEQLFKTQIHSQDLELLLEYYFTLRMNLHKPFYWRKFPAGDSSHIVDYLSQKKFKLVKTITNVDLSWYRQFRLYDVLAAIRDGTYHVFAQNLSGKERKKIYQKLIDFTNVHNMKLNNPISIPAHFVINIMQKK